MYNSIHINEMGQIIDQVNGAVIGVSNQKKTEMIRDIQMLERQIAEITEERDNYYNLGIENGYIRPKPTIETLTAELEKSNQDRMQQAKKMDEMAKMLQELMQLQKSKENTIDKTTTQRRNIKKQEEQQVEE